jgi:hypothetical protein
MDWLHNALDFIVQSLLSEFVAVVAGVLFVQLVQRQWEKWRFGGWKVIILKEGTTLLNREITPRKTKEILGEETDLAVFLKGVASPYEWINCDPLEEGRRNGLLVIDQATRRFTLDLDKNPSRSTVQPTEIERLG